MENNKKRRRGEELQQAIYAATLEILENEGYDAVTFANVAKKAHTSRSVLYNQWKSPFLLLFRAGRDQVIRNGGRPLSALEFSLDSTLREDLILLGERFIENGKRYPKNFLFAYYSTRVQHPEYLDELTDMQISTNLRIMKEILANALSRGEITHLPDEQLMLFPIEYFRYYIMNNPEKLDRKFIETFVDGVCLPVYMKKS
ncbi:MAG: TetR/AcrR family transcriptional regulator [Streptococcaceae bacterium]|jgi:AcrR family transcriptional regulator|nr:TetR/AcrR family transcriptional regulator [Streptococcaceae bacterium]